MFRSVEILELSVVQSESRSPKRSSLRWAVHSTNVACGILRLILPLQTLRQKLADIPEINGDISPAALAQDVSHLKDIPVS